jgi:hypothetical protein
VYSSRWLPNATSITKQRPRSVVRAVTTRIICNATGPRTNRSWQPGLSCRLRLLRDNHQNNAFWRTLKVSSRNLVPFPYNQHLIIFLDPYIFQGSQIS